MHAFYENVTEQLNTIEDCLELRRIIPCLCLIYSCIDVVASLERRPNEGTKAAFVRWVSENMSKARPLPCTPLWFTHMNQEVVQEFLKGSADATQ